jgi:hypothetical protein
LAAAVLAAQRGAEEQRSAALAAGVQALFPSELADLDRRLSQARPLASSNPQEARARFDDLARDYRSLAERAPALTAREAMRQERQAAVVAGAEQRDAARLAQADAIRDRALASFNAGNYSGSAAQFNEAGEAYKRIAADLAAAAPAAEPAVTPEAALAALVEQFCELYQRGDMLRLNAELYRGEMPRADREYFRAIFDRSEGLTVQVRNRRPRIEGSTAVVDLDLTLRFRQARTGERATLPEQLRLTFVADDGGWRLQRTERRR